MATRRSKNTRCTKKTVKYTEAWRERKLVLSGKKFNTRETQVLCYESSLKLSLGKAS
jgi:hypothetical protein